MASDLVIIHWRILKPQINVVDAKYTLLDKFANFGGNFGIFAEITGCSFLGMLNFLILLCKLTFLRCQNTGGRISDTVANITAKWILVLYKVNWIRSLKPMMQKIETMYLYVISCMVWIMKQIEYYQLFEFLYFYLLNMQLSQLGKKEKIQDGN